MTFADTSSTTSSPASADGVTPFDWLDGPTTEPSGPDHARASLSARQAKEKGLLTSGTFGQPGTGSLASVGLTSSLANRLRTAVSGSILFQQTWKQKATPSGRQYSVHTASAPRTSGKDSTGWPSPKANNHTGTRGEGGDNLQTVAVLSSWPTTTKQDSASSGARDYSTESGRHSGTTLTDAARLASWPTPMAGTPARNGNNEAGNTDSSRRTVALIGWNTPRATDGSNGGPNQANGALSADAALTSWGTPAARDWKDGACQQADVPTNALLGRQATLCGAETASGGQLNPAHSRWLMGYPNVWDSCGVTAMQSCRKTRRRSSKHPDWFDL